MAHSSRKNAASVSGRSPQGTNFGGNKAFEGIFVGGTPTLLAGQIFLI
jgi:hypothetical protein